MSVFLGLQCREPSLRAGERFLHEQKTSGMMYLCDDHGVHLHQEMTMQRSGCCVSMCFTYMCNLWWQTRKIRSLPYNVCLSWHLTKVNKLIISVGYNLLFSFCYTLGPKVIQTSEANFSLNNSKKVRLDLEWQAMGHISIQVTSNGPPCPAGCFSANTVSGWPLGPYMTKWCFLL